MYGLRVGLLDAMVVDVLVLDATSVAFFIMAVSNLHSHRQHGRGSLFPHGLSAFIICRLCADCCQMIT